MASSNRRAEGLAQALGWFSIGLGTAQLAVPDAVEQLIGLRPTERNRALMRAIGVRELASGVGLLTSGSPAFLWARVAGDGMDLALLSSAVRNEDSDDGRRSGYRDRLAPDRAAGRRPRRVAGPYRDRNDLGDLDGTEGRDGDRRRIGSALAAVAGVTALDLFAALARTSDQGDRSQGAAESRAELPREATSSITVNEEPTAVYRRWRDIERLPTFMTHLVSVTDTGDRRSHWVAQGPAGTTVEWDAEITEEVPGERLAWTSIEGASVQNRGAVTFRAAPGGRGTEVHVTIDYALPGGPVGALVAKLFGEEPDQQLSDDLRRFKQMVETGEIARSDGAPAGIRMRDQAGQRAAQPLAHDEVIDLTRQEVDA